MPDRAALLIERVRESLAETHDLLGDIGSDEQGVPLYLAREKRTGALVGISVTQAIGTVDEYEVEVRRTLGESVRVQGSVCPECNAPLPDLERFCFQCGSDLSSVIPADGAPEAARVLTALATATAGRFEILGRMDVEGRVGTVYFARELSTGRITALRVRRAEAADAVQAEFVVKQTQIFRVPAAPVGKRAVAGDVSPRTVAPSPVFPSAVGETSLPQPMGSNPPGGARRTGIVAAVAATLVAVVAFVATRGDHGRPASTNASTTATSPTGTVATSTGVPATAAGGTGPAAGATVPNAQPLPAPSSNATVDSGTIRIQGALPATVRLTLDGAVVRGRVLRVKAGTHQLAASASGMQTVTKKLTVLAKGSMTWEPKLAPLPVASSTGTPAAVPDVQPRATASCKLLVKREDWNAAFMQCGTDAIEGDIVSAGQLGRLYAQGLGTKKNPKEAVTWFTMAAQGGDHEAQVQLGYALRDGSGTSRDKTQAAKWFKQAADGGDGTGAMEYGVMLERGDGLPRDVVAARAAYRLASEHGNAVGARRLAQMMESGTGGAKSDDDAAIAYQRSASLGDAASALTIGRWYRDGRGVTKSSAQAIIWFKRAAELGNSEASKELRKLEPGA